MTKIKLGKYRHFKGKDYEVIGVARDCENPGRELVIYKALYGENFRKDRSGQEN